MLVLKFCFSSIQVRAFDYDRCFGILNNLLFLIVFSAIGLNMFNKSDEQLSKATCDMTKSLLLQHCLQNYPHIPVCCFYLFLIFYSDFFNFFYLFDLIFFLIQNKFDQLLAQLPKFRTLSMRGQRNLHTLHSPMRRPFESLLIEVLVGNHENVEAHFLSKSQL